MYIYVLIMKIILILLDDGRECRVRFEKIAEDATIAGYLPEDCFEGIPMYF